MHASYHGIPGALTISLKLSDLPAVDRINILNQLARELGVWDAITASSDSAKILAAIDAAWGRAVVPTTIGSELGEPLSDASANLNAIRQGG